MRGKCASSHLLSPPLSPVHVQLQLRTTLGGIKVLLTCMMDEQPTNDNGNVICEVVYIMLV